MTRIPRDPFFEIEPSDTTQRYLDTLIPLRAGLYLDPDLALPWTCDPGRCRRASPWP